MREGLPLGLLDLIRASIPTFQAAELLVSIAATPDREFTVEDIAVSMGKSSITVPALREYLALFVKGDLLIESNGRLRYAPKSRDLESSVSQLVVAYNERPVSLITEIYRIADQKLQALSGGPARYRTTDC